MKVLVLCFFVACTSATPVWPIVGYPASFSSKYHAQDELGQAAYGYAYPGQAATNYRDAFGNQVGSYAYINAEGKEVQVSYTADHRGFRVLSNDLPVAPVDEGVAPVFEGKAPEPVQDTPEVVAAKAEFAKLFKEAEIAAAAVPEVVEVVAPVVDSPAADVPVVVEEVKAVETPIADAPIAVEEVKAAETPVADVSVAVEEVKLVDTPVVEDKPDPAVVAVVAAYDDGKIRDWVNEEEDPVAVASVAEEKPVADGLVEVSRKRRQIPILPYTSAIYRTALSVPLVAPVPLVTKTTLKTVTAEADLTAKTPADTNKFDLKEKTFDVVTPLAYHNAYAYTYPNAYPYLNGLY